MNRKSIYWGLLFSIVLASLIFILGSDRKDYNEFPVTVYQVYLKGESVGVIENEEELYSLIDKEQKNLKNEFRVNKIYAPIGLETTKLVTYNGSVDSVEEVYNKIKDVEPFSVKGYEVSIVHSEDNIEKINLLNEEDFQKAIDLAVKAFVEEETYDKYLKNTQSEIATTGSTIENIYLKENVTIKEKYLSTEEKIYRDAEELSKYILFGTDEIQGTHIVSAGQTIKEIADMYELNVKEFLIVNPDIKSKTALLFSGQKVNIGLVNPVVSIVVEKTVVEDQEIPYQTETEYDNTYVVGTTFTQRQGQNGLSRITYMHESINGTPTRVVPTKTEELSPSINEIIIKGGLQISQIGNDGNWRWPTNRPYVITSEFGWRTDPIYGGRAFHRGIDISGTGYGSPIYAARDGYISSIGYRSDMGYYIDLTHEDPNGEVKSIYMHMCDFAAGMAQGVYVHKGDVIGYMGSSGDSTGTHLDFRIVINGTYHDPLTFKYN